MNDFIDSALAQLRAADPTATTLVPDPRSAIGQAMLEQVLAAAEPTPVRRLVTRRRVFVGSAVAAAAAAVVERASRDRRVRRRQACRRLDQRDRPPGRAA